MFLTLDNLAKRYGCLPSEALRRADTLDLYVLDLGGKWARYQQEQADGKVSNRKSHKLTQAEMQAMLDRVKKERQ